MSYIKSGAKWGCIALLGAPFIATAYVAGVVAKDIGRFIYKYPRTTLAAIATTGVLWNYCPTQDVWQHSKKLADNTVQIAQKYRTEHSAQRAREAEMIKIQEANTRMGQDLNRIVAEYNRTEEGKLQAERAKGELEEKLQQTQTEKAQVQAQAEQERIAREQQMQTLQEQTRQLQNYQEELRKLKTAHDQRPASSPTPSWQAAPVQSRAVDERSDTKITPHPRRFNISHDPNNCYYIVKLDETSEGISKRITGTSRYAELILENNGIADSRKLMVGEMLAIPRSLCVNTVGTLDGKPDLESVVLPGSVKISERFENAAAVTQLQTLLGLPGDSFKYRSGERKVYY